MWVLYYSAAHLRSHVWAILAQHFVWQNWPILFHFRKGAYCIIFTYTVFLKATFIHYSNGLRLDFKYPFFSRAMHATECGTDYVGLCDKMKPINGEKLLKFLRKVHFTGKYRSSQQSSQFLYNSCLSKVKKTWTCIDNCRHVCKSYHMAQGVESCQILKSVLTLFMHMRYEVILKLRM